MTKPKAAEWTAFDSFHLEYFDIFRPFAANPARWREVDMLWRGHRQTWFLSCPISAFEAGLIRGTAFFGEGIPSPACLETS